MGKLDALYGSSSVDRPLKQSDRGVSVRPPGAGSSQDEGNIKKNKKKKATPQDYLDRWRQSGEKWKEQRQPEVSGCKTELMNL